MVIYLSLLVAVVGWALYVLTADTHPKTQELGRLAFFAGLFVFLLRFNGEILGALK